MTTGIPRTLTIATCLLLGATASAGGSSTLPIDSEQKAAAAVVAAFFASGETVNHHQFIFPGVISLGMRALQSASQATTPVALMTMPGGVEIPCATSGSMRARLAPKLPRVFRFEWRQCHFPQDGYDQGLNGAGEIVLLSDSFTPEKVASIRFGASGQDLVHTQTLSAPGFSFQNVYLRNILLVGSIPMKNLQYGFPDSFTAFSYLVNGFVDFTQTNQFGSEPPTSFGSHYTFDAVAYSGSVAYNEDATRLDQDLNALFGKFAFTRRDPPPYGTTSDIYRFLNFRVHNSNAWVTGEYTQTIDGRVDLTWSPNFGTGCLNGAYDFRTRVPLHQVSQGFYQPFDSGELVINGTERASFYSASNVPPTLPAPSALSLLHIDAAGVGSFNYGINDLLNDLRSVSHCQ